MTEPAREDIADIDDAEELREACRALQREVEWLGRAIDRRAEVLELCGLDYCDDGSAITLDIVDRERAAVWFREADDEASARRMDDRGALDQ